MRLTHVGGHPRAALEAIRVLNEALERDPVAVSRLIAYRVPCNIQLADHPSIQVGGSNAPPDPAHEVGILGIINGLFGTRTDGWGFITAIIEDDGRVLRFDLTRREGDGP
jgi:hypothetical protein